MKGNSRITWERGAAAMAVSLLALQPPLAAAQECPQPYASATLLEVREDIVCHPGGATDPICLDGGGGRGFGTRIADATLTGTVVGPPEFSGEMSVEASSILSQVDWTGPAHGKITVQNSLGNTVSAVFSGQLNLSLAVLGTPPTPLAPISGHWRGTKGTLNAGGTLSGVFLIPFACPPATGLAGACYLEVDCKGAPTGGVTPLLPSEFSPGGVPLVKLQVNFFNKN